MNKNKSVLPPHIVDCTRYSAKYVPIGMIIVLR